MTDLNQINTLVQKVLSLKKSIYVGICAEVLKYEKVDSSPCRRHSVTLKDIRKPECVQSTCEDEILVVDSAFFSIRSRNRDGSSWIPASIVIQAIAKSANDFEQIMKNASLPTDIRSSANSAAHSTIKDIKQVLAEFPRSELKKQVEIFLGQYIQQFSGGNKELESDLLTQFNLNDIQTTDDIEKTLPVFEQLFIFAMKKQSSPDLRLTGNGIIWFE